MNNVSFETLLGKVLIKVEVIEEEEEIKFIDNIGGVYKLYHSQQCCENVRIEDIEGDILDLIGYPILQADESTNTEDLLGKPEQADGFTWTFYKLATIKGYVTIRFFGTSNGCYSETAQLYEE